jgi:adenine-specific DNA-methyltransferase
MLDKLPHLLGKPFYAAPSCRIYNLDCLAAMQQIAQPCVHITVTSPPYNIGKAYEQPLPLEEYLGWCARWLAEIHRLTLPTGAFWLNLGYVSIPGRAKAIPLPYLLWQHIPFFLIQEIVWNYGAGVAGRKFYSPRNEKFLWYVKDENNYTFHLDKVRDPNIKYPHQKKQGRIKVNAIGKNPSDVWQFPKVTSGLNRSSKERTVHPAQFPEEVIRRILISSSNEQELVLDPFIGSGTTAIVALQLNRSVLGFETNPSYCQIAADRVENYLSQREQPGLFD